MSLARQYFPRARILFGVGNLHHVRLARQARLEERDELLAESRRLQLAECMAALFADAVITHSALEAETLRRLVPGVNVHVVPWAIAPRRARAPFARRRGVGFVADYTQPANADAARFLAGEIMPLVWRHDPAIPCLLAGNAMPDSLHRLAGPGLETLGPLADLADVFDRVRLTAAPLRHGGGTSGQVLTSLAAGVASVMTPLAAEGIALPPPLTGLIGATAEELAAHLLRLHADSAALRDAGRAGVALIKDGYSERRVETALQAALQPALLAATG